jgi:hypothetical protein
MSDLQANGRGEFGRNSGANQLRMKETRGRVYFMPQKGNDCSAPAGSETTAG